MRQLHSPSPIEVEVPARHGARDSSPVSLYTELFRDGSFLPEALHLASERTAELPGLSVISAACSIGAEADSLLALYDKEDYKGEVVLEGHDINPLALKAARRGLYTVLAGTSGMRDYQEVILGRLGFDISYEPYGDSDTKDKSLLKADAAPVRSGHSVEFTEHDLMEPLPAAGQADLVLANNLLYHLSPERATRVLENLCRALSDNGVLSLGALTMCEETPWREATLRLLDQKFGLKPVFSAAGEEIPVMFGRT
jgi:chemotaxis protein methyltransferase CheR